MITAIVLALCVGLVVIGGIQRISKVSQVIVPFMAVTYILAALVLIFANLNKLPGAFVEILKVPLVCVPWPVVHCQLFLWQCRKV